MHFTNHYAASVKLIVGGFVLIGVLAASSACQSTGNDTTRTGTDDTGDTGDLAPRPARLEDLVQRAKVIVIATVGDVERETSEGPVGRAPTPDPSAPSLPQFAFTYYSVKVDAVIAGTEELKPGQTFTLRINGSEKNKEQSGGLTMMPQPGEQRLFVLESDPTIPDAHFPHPWGIFDIGDDPVKFDDVERTSVATLTQATSPAAFADALRAAMASRS